MTFFSYSKAKEIKEKIRQLNVSLLPEERLVVSGISMKIEQAKVLTETDGINLTQIAKKYKI
jgi:hypothetical protein